MDKYKEFKAYQDLYRNVAIEDKDLCYIIQNMLPCFLYLDNDKTTLDHFFFNELIIDYLEKSENGGLVCPLCESGLHQNKSGALSFDKEKHFFKCFACNTLFFPLDENVTSIVSSHLYNTMKLFNCQEKNQNFQENIDVFNKQLLLKDLDIDDEERKAFIKKTFCNRAYSDATINYIFNSHLFHVIENESLTKELYVTMYDNNLKDIIGYQKLHFNDFKEELKKYQEDGSLLGFTPFFNSDFPNCCFIVESITNAISIYQCGFNALCVYTCNKQPEKAYNNLLQKGMQPILFLDRDVKDIDKKYNAINWIKDIESNFSFRELKENADACDLLALSSDFLYKLLRTAYNDFYKKQQPIYSQMTLEEAFASEAKFNIIEAPVGEGKTTQAIKVFNKASNPLYSVYSKSSTKDVGKACNCNVVTSDGSKITEDKKGISTTHARLGKTTKLEDFGIKWDKEKLFDTVLIDEKHDFLQCEDITISQLYSCDASEDSEDKAFDAIFANSTLIAKAKERAEIIPLGYKRENKNNATRPIKMPEDYSYNDFEKHQVVYLNQKYTTIELSNPKFYDNIAQGTTNIMTKRIDSNSSYFLPNYALNASISTMIKYDYEMLKEELKATFKNDFKSFRNLYLALSMPFFRYCYLECAFPIRESDNKILSLEEYLEDVKAGVEMKKTNNEAPYFQVHLRFINMQPLLKALKFSKRLFLFGASKFPFQEQFIEEFKAYFADDFNYFSIAPNATKEKSTTIINCKRLFDESIGEVMKYASDLDCYKVFVFPTYDRTDDFYKMQEELSITNYSRATKEGFKSYVIEDSIELESIDNRVNKDAFRDLLVHGNCPILQSSNKLAKYTLMFLDCNQFKPKLAYVNPYLEDLGTTIVDTLKSWFIQTVGRLYRQQGNEIVIVLLNYKSLEFDYTTLLKEKSEVVKVFEDGNNYSYYGNSAIDFVSNIEKALKGEEMTKFKINKHSKLTEEEKQQNKEIKKQEKALKKEEKIKELIIKGASKREIQRATSDYKDKSTQEWLALNRSTLATFAPKGECPFDDEILKSIFVTYDVEVFPNVFIICFHSDKGKGYSVVNPDYDFLSHFVKLPLIGFNNANYDNLILYYALTDLSCNALNYRFENEEKADFNTRLKAFSDEIIANEDNKNKHVTNIKRVAKAIGLGDSQIMVVKNLQGHSNDSIKVFMLDFGQEIIESPYPFDTVLTQEQIEEVKAYCMNDSLAVYNLLTHKKYSEVFKTSLKLCERTGLNGNYSKLDLYSEIVYDKKLTYKERCQYNRLTIEAITKDFPNFKVLPGKDAKERYVNEFDDYVYVLGNGGFALLESRVFKKNQDGSLTPIENNHGFYKHVISLDISSMHPHSIIAINYFGEYTENYKNMLKMKDLCSSMKEMGFEYVKNELAKYGFFVNIEDDVNILRSLFKFVLNGTYGLTHMSYENQLSKCSHNLIALRGSAFISTLHHELIHRFPNIKIIQIKTDSIKLAEYTQDQVDFCMNFAKNYGYTFVTESLFDAIVCNGNDYIALNYNGELKNSLEKREEEIEEDEEDYEALFKGGSFKLLYDDRGELRKRGDLRTLLYRFKGKYSHKLGIKHKEGNKAIYDFVKDVKSSKVKYYLAVKDDYQEGLLPYYINKNGVFSSLSGFTSQKVIPIYSLKQLESIDKSVIDYDYYQKRLNKVLDKVLNLMLEKKVTDETIKALQKQKLEKRHSMKLNLLDEKERSFYTILKNKLAFV